VLERPDTKEPIYGLRHLHRFTLGTPFTQIVQEVRRLVGRLSSAEEYPTLLVDLTGVGRPVLDMIRRTSMPASIVPVCITAGQQASTQEDGTRLLPKIELVSCLQVLLQSRRLRVARDLPAANVLARELQNFRMKVTLTAGDAMAAWRENQHDDLVFAVAMACWMAEREPPLGPDAYACGGGSLLANMPKDLYSWEDEDTPKHWMESMRF